MADITKKKIILNADDYAACEFINKGITDAIKLKKINSVSCFVTHGRSRTDVLELIDLQAAHDFKIGLHFSITCGYPVSLCSTMKPGPGKAFYEVHQHDYLNISTDELRTELRNQVNQLQAFLDTKNAGKVDHITVHHGVIYFFDRLFKVFCEVAHEYNIPVRSPLPWSKSDLSFFVFNLGVPIKLEGLKNGAKLFWDNLMHRDIREKEVLKMLRGQNKKTITGQIENMKGILRHPMCFVDTIYGQPYPENLTYLISQVPDNNTVELMFHLGAGDPDGDIPAGINRRYFKWRTKELDAIRKVDLNKLMTQHRVGMVNYGSF